MNVFSTVCEYNPFHKGHEYHLAHTKNNENDVIVAVMSGNFVERCESAVIDKRLRAAMALSSGADLLIELPLPFATASAEIFASRAIEILNSLGCVDFLSFGSECGDIELLKSTSRMILSDEVDRQILAELKSGVSYPRAREAAVAGLYGSKYSDILKEPNNILGVEYIKALIKQDSNIAPMTVKRKGAAHDSVGGADRITSASDIRRRIFGQAEFLSFLPPQSARIFQNAVKNETAPCDFNRLETAILASLRLKTADSFKNIPDVSEGIENRIVQSVKMSTTLNEVYDNAKTKRYTHSRIRRIILRSFLGITNEFMTQPMPYIRILGFNTKGKEVLRLVKKSCSVPVIMSASDAKNLNSFGRSLFALECRSVDVFNLTLPKKRICGTDMTDNLVIFE